MTLEFLARSHSARAPSALPATTLDAQALSPNAHRTISALIGEIDRLRAEADRLHRQLADLEAIADADPLAPTLNRRAFVREMGRIMAYAERYAAPASLLFVDMNGFKAINDVYGHAVGDQALIHVAQLLKRHVRDSDLVGRIGGDEFAIVLARSDGASARAKARGLAELIGQDRLQTDQGQIRLSATIGAYDFRGGESAEAALARADQDMYRRKRANAEAPVGSA